MVSVKKLLKDTVGKLIFREVIVVRSRVLAPSFQLLLLEGESLKNALWKPGDKVQVMLDAGARTYTPFGFDGARGTMQLLSFAHGDSPGARWGRSVREGERAFVFGPRSSLALRDIDDAAVLFGDETSFAVALTLREHCAPRPTHFVFEVSDREAAQAVLSELGFARDAVSLVERGADGAHLVRVEEALRAALRSHAPSSLVLTGGAASIQALRSRLKAQPVSPTRTLSKAYWAAGKRGLD